MLRHISLDTEFLEAGRNPQTRAGQIAPASIALVDVFGQNAFYGVVEGYDADYVQNLLFNKNWSTLPIENPGLAKRLHAFQSEHILPKLRLDSARPNSISQITINGEDYNLDYQIARAPDLGRKLISFLSRTKGDETGVKLWARQGASDQIVSRMFFDGLLPFKSALKRIDLSLAEGEVNDLKKHSHSNHKKPPESLAHGCLYDAAFDAQNIAMALGNG